MTTSKNKGVVVITGAAGGMGVPCATRFAAAGHPLLLCDVNAQRLEKTAEQLRPKATGVDTLAGDIADPSYTDRLVSLLGERRVHALIHTAGLSPTMGDPARIFDVNFFATERLVQAIGPKMEEGGCAVLISSSSAYMLKSPEIEAAVGELLSGKGADSVRKLCTTPQSAYPISKRAVIGLVAREAWAFGQRKTRIVSIAPGLIDTDMQRAEMAVAQQIKQMLERTPLGRMGRGDEIASVAEFLCSPAASYISGCDIKVDGGTLANLGF